MDTKEITQIIKKVNKRFIKSNEIRVGDVIIGGYFSSLLVYKVLRITKNGRLYVLSYNTAYWDGNNSDTFNNTELNEQTGFKKYIYPVNIYYLLSRENYE